MFLAIRYSNLSFSFKLKKIKFSLSNLDSSKFDTLEIYTYKYSKRSTKNTSYALRFFIVYETMATKAINTCLENNL